jgi:hypothetical protein
VIRALEFLTGWALLTPITLLFYLRLGGPYQDWMAPLLDIAASAPLLGFSTIAGLVVLGLLAVTLLRSREEF